VKFTGKRITKCGLALLAIVILGLVLRLYHLGTQSIWIDEASSIWLAKLSLPQIVQNTAGLDIHPPLYFFLLHFWIKAFGSSEFAVRLLSAFFGVLAIPVIYLIGQQLFDKRTGLLGALILAVSSFNIQYSQETRMYSLMLLLALLSIYCFLRLSQQRTLAFSALYVVSTSLLLYTHVYGILVLVAQNIYIVTMLRELKNRGFRLRYWGMLQAIVIVLFAPWIGVLIYQISWVEQGFWLAPPTLDTIFGTFVAYAGTVLLLAIFAALSAFSLIKYKKTSGSMDWKAPLNALQSYSWEVSIQDPAPVYFLGLWLLVISVIPFAFSYFTTPIYSVRYTIAASPALYLLAARGIKNINYRYAKLAAIGIIVILSVANLQTYYGSITYPQGREAINVINENAKNGDLVILAPLGTWLEWHYYGTAKVNAVNFPAATSSDAATVKEVSSDINGSSRVWLLQETGGSPEVAQQVTLRTLNAEQLTLRTLNESYQLTSFNQFVGYRVYLFEKRV
jgi:uncharacterized membrane protein